MMVYDLGDIAKLNVQVVKYRSVLCNMTRNDVLNMLNNSKLDDKGTL